MATSAIAILDASGHLTWANRAMVALLDRPLDALSGDGWRRSLHARDFPRVVALWRRASTERRPVNVQLETHDAAGHSRWITAEVTPVPAGDQPITAWIVVAAAMAAGTSGYLEQGPLSRIAGAVLERAPIGIEVFGRDGSSAAVNRAQLELVGSDRGTTVGRTNPLRDPLAAATRPDFQRAFAGETVDAEFEVPLGDLTLNRWGSTRETITVHQTLVPVMSPEGDVEHVVAFVRDVTAERRERAAVEEERALLAQATANVGECVWVMAPDGLTFRYLSPNFEDVWCMNRHEVLSDPQAILRRIHPDDVAGLLSAEDSGDNAAATYRIVLPDGEVRWLTSSRTIVRDPVGRVVSIVGSDRDVTAERAAEEVRRREQDEAAAREHAASLSRLAGGVAHDFNNLLAAILGHAALALESLPDGSPVAADLHEIEVASRRAAELAQQMLAYAGQAQSVMRPVSLAAVVRTVIAGVGPAIGDHDLRAELGTTAGLVTGDSAQLTRVIRELIVNAVEALATVGPGSVTVSLAEVIDADAAAWVRLAVTDTGPGMDEATQARLFEPFFTTKMMGRGLGMAASMGIVRAHGGQMSVRSEPEAGTTFEVLLPAIPRPTGTPGKAADGIDARATVLVVEEDPTLARLASRVLERAGFAVVLAPGGSDGAAIVLDHGRRIDAMLVNLGLAEAGGSNLAGMARAARPGLPIVVASGWSEDEARERLDGYDAYLAKPYHPDELASIIARVLERAPVPT